MRCAIPSLSPHFLRVVNLSTSFHLLFTELVHSNFHTFTPPLKLLFLSLETSFLISHLFYSGSRVPPTPPPLPLVCVWSHWCRLSASESNDSDRRKDRRRVFSTMKVQLLLLLALVGLFCAFARASKCTVFHCPAVSTLCPVSASMCPPYTTLCLLYPLLNETLEAADSNGGEGGSLLLPVHWWDHLCPAKMC